MAHPMNHKVVARLKQLAADCAECRRGFCCGTCLCCVAEDVVEKLVKDAQREEPSRENKMEKPTEKSLNLTDKLIDDLITAANEHGETYAPCLRDDLEDARGWVRLRIAAMLDRETVNR